MAIIDRAVSGRVGVARRDAKDMSNYPLTIEQAARYLAVPISALRLSVQTTKVLNGKPAPIPHQHTGRNIWFLLEELDRYKESAPL